MQIVDLSNEIWLELSQPNDITIPSISTWLRFNSNLGSLNNYINKSFFIDASSLEIFDPDNNNNTIGIMEASIYAQMFYVYYYGKKVNDYLFAAGLNTLIEAQEDGGSLRFISPNEIAKTYLQLKKDSKLFLDKLINAYKFNVQKVLQVVGDDLFVQRGHPLFEGRQLILT